MRSYLERAGIELKRIEGKLECVKDERQRINEAYMLMHRGMIKRLWIRGREECLKTKTTF